MTFTPSDVESLSRSLSRWELGEYIFEALVIVACAGELVADLASSLTEKHKRRLERWSTMLLVAALSMELICLVRTNELSGSVIGSLGDKADDANRRVKKALDDSALAITQSGQATTKADKAANVSAGAFETSYKASASASHASVLARDARREADSFEKDIVSAKTKAAEAESHLAEALRQAADATAELNRIKTPRSLLHESEMVSALAIFKGTEYGFFRSLGMTTVSICYYKLMESYSGQVGRE